MRIDAAHLDPLERADEPALERGVGPERVHQQLDGRMRRHDRRLIGAVTARIPPKG